MATAPTPEACASRLVDVHMRVFCAIRDELRTTDLSLAQFRTLKHLHHSAGTGLGELADDIGVSAPAMSKLVDGLVERGLVERASQTADRRRIELQVSPAGRRALDKVRQAVVARLAFLLAPLTPAQRSALADALGGLEQALAPKEVLA